MDLTYIICGGIIFIGFLIFLFLVVRARKKAKAIVHYESIRDKLTLREEEEEEKVQEIIGLPSLMSLIMALVVISIVGVIGFTILGEFTEAISDPAMANITTTSQELMSVTASTFSLIPILLVGFMIATVLGIFLTVLGRKDLI